MEVKENGLQVREVNFNGDTLLAGQDYEGKIWAGIKWMCQGIGLSEGQIKSERKRIQTDLVLKQGGRNFVLPTKSGIQDVLCLYIDFVPLWLAKISITPTMQRDNPQLVEKLIQYQLKVKDVLAKEFVYGQASESSMSTQLEYRLVNLENTVAQIIDYQTQLLNGQQLTYKLIRRGLFPPVNTSAWKNEIYVLASEIAQLKPDKYRGNSYVLSEFYKVMRDTYGFVEEQSIKEYKERHNTTSQVFTIDLIADDKQLRDIFKNLLTDYLTSLKSVMNYDNVPKLSPIEQLIEKRQDKSPYGVQTYKFIYKQMMSNRSWKNRMTRYKNSNGVNTASKPELIKSNEQLQVLFNKTVECILQNYTLNS